MLALFVWRGTIYVEQRNYWRSYQNFNSKFKIRQRNIFILVTMMLTLPVWTIQLQFIPNNNVLKSHICSYSSIYPFLCLSALFQYVTGSWDQLPAFLKGKGVRVSPQWHEFFRVFWWSSFLFGCSSISVFSVCSTTLFFCWLSSLVRQWSLSVVKTLSHMVQFL